MKRIHCFTTHFLQGILLLTIVATSKGFAGGPDRITLNGTWKFKYFPTPETGNDSLFYQNSYSDSDWSSIQVPGHWDLQGFGEPSERAIPPMVGLYRTSFGLSGEMKNHRVFIRFDGVQYGFKFYINGKYVGSWASSYNAADFDITDYVNASSENILAVKVAVDVKGYEFDINDCWRLAGIYRDVTLYFVPGICINDYTVQTRLQGNNQEARVKVNADFGELKQKQLNNLRLNGILHTPDGKQYEQKIPVVSSTDSLIFTIPDPVLWTAETPELYRLELVLMKGNKVLDYKEQQVGIRQISIRNRILKLNGKPIKLRGVDHHDLVPETGRTLSRWQILNDLVIMRKANINFIRTSHYPPDRRMLDLCDSLGFYVMCEVPFGGGDSHLTDTSYGGILLTRAKATLLRDKNHPCIIIWSLGNENPVTPITEEVGKYVQKADPTRPICYPQMGSYFNANYKTFPDFLDIYTPHYQGAAWIANFQKESTRPVIMTEYAHALGLSFGNMDDVWREMFRSDKFAGGAVWHFHDQGILRKAKEPVDRKLPTNFVWKDSVTFYDTRGIDGTDGIVYSDRTPQVDYWQVRKVYSPVQVIETSLLVTGGKQTIKFSLYNQFDFLNLDVLNGRWKLVRNRDTVAVAAITVVCSPHDTVDYALTIDLPDNPERDSWYLQLDFLNKHQEPVYKHTIELVTPFRYNNLKEIICQSVPEPLGAEKTQNGSRIDHKGFRYDFSGKDLSFCLSDNTKTGKILIEGLYPRVGRILNISDRSVKTDEALNLWCPHLLTAQQVIEANDQRNEKGFVFGGKADYPRGTEYPGQKLTGDIRYDLNENGILTISYAFTPENATGLFAEAGLSLELSPELTDVMWIGNGPYPGYPDKYLFNDFGIHTLKKGDLNFNGNRSGVELVAVTDAGGNGLAIIADNDDISFEVMDGKIILSHNAMLMGLGNKKSRSVVRLNANSIGEIKGEIKILPLHSGKWPAKLIEVMGLPDPSIKPYQPFYHSYDLTW